MLPTHRWDLHFNGTSRLALREMSNLPKQVNDYRRKSSSLLQRCLICYLVTCDARVVRAVLLCRIS